MLKILFPLDEWQGEVTQITAGMNQGNTTTGGIPKKLDSNFKMGQTPVTFVRAHKLPVNNANNGAPTLDEITNKVFNELLQGKVEAQGMQNGINSNTREGSVKVFLPGKIVRFTEILKYI